MNPLSQVRTGAIAQQMLKQAGLADDEHSMLADNLTGYLAKTPEPLLERFEQSGGKPAEILPDLINEAAYTMPPSALRPLMKIQRDLQQPYTNTQVFDRVQKVENRLRDELAAKIQSGTPYPQRMWVVGSLAKGGFGGNSDADVIVDVGASTKPIMMEDSQHLFEMMSLRHGEQEAQFAFFGSRVEVDPKSLLSGEKVLMPIFLKSLPAERHTVSGSQG